MIIENELRFYRHDDYRASFVSWFIKLIITVSTVILLLLIFYYYYLDLILDQLKNSFISLFQGLTIAKLYSLCSELLICSIHPLPLHSFTSINASSIQAPSLTSIDLDIALGLPSSSHSLNVLHRWENKLISMLVLVFLRLYLFSRLLMYYSSLYSNGSSECLGCLNRVPINVFFLMKTYLEQHPARCLLIFVFLIFCIGSWSLRVCNYRSATEHLTVFDAMWLFFVTFTTVGLFVSLTYDKHSIVSSRM